MLRVIRGIIHLADSFGILHADGNASINEPGACYDLKRLFAMHFCPLGGVDRCSFDKELCNAGIGFSAESGDLLHGKEASGQGNARMYYKQI